MGGLTPSAWAELLRLAATARSIRDGGDEDDHQRRAHAFAERIAVAEAASAGGDLASVYARLIAAVARGPLTIAQLGQTLDGRIATATGHSRYISCDESLDHLHRLRALVDAVVVGASTVQLDDPQLTTRRVEGASPLRVVIDPRRRLSPAARVFDGSVATLILVEGEEATHPAASPNVRVAAFAPRNGTIDPGDILRCLWSRGLRSVLVEGGAQTISLFLRHRRVDRLHVAVAPLVLGSGTSAVSLPPIARIDEALHLAMRAYLLGVDVLFDCELG